MPPRDRNARNIDFQELWDWFNDTSIWPASQDTWRISAIDVYDDRITVYIYPDVGSHEIKVLQRT